MSAKENLQVFKSTDGGATFGPPANGMVGGGCDLHGQFVSCRVDGLVPGASEIMKVQVVGSTAGTFSDSARVTTSSNDSADGDDTGDDAVTITD